MTKIWTSESKFGPLKSGWEWVLECRLLFSSNSLHLSRTALPQRRWRFSSNPFGSRKYEGCTRWLSPQICAEMPAPPSKYPRFGGSKKDKKSISKISRACNPIEIIPNRWTKEPNFAVACLIHLLTRRPRNRPSKTRRGLVISIFTNVRKKSTQRPYDE